jgi:hypothetical protein
LPQQSNIVTNTAKIKKKNQHHLTQKKQRRKKAMSKQIKARVALIRQLTKSTTTRTGTELAEQFKEAFQKHAEYKKLSFEQQQQTLSIIDNECLKHEAYGVFEIIKLGKRLEIRIQKEVKTHEAT